MGEAVDGLRTSPKSITRSIEKLERIPLGLENDWNEPIRLGPEDATIFRRAAHHACMLCFNGPTKIIARMRRMSNAAENGFFNHICS